MLVPHMQKPKRDYAAFKTEMQQHGRHKKPHADSTISALEGISERWNAYCAAQQQGDHDARLRNADVSDLKTFIQWLVDNARGEPPQASTLKQYFRVLKMKYKGLTGADLDKDQVIDVNNFIEHSLEGKGKTSPRPKPVPSGADFVKIVHFHYAKDPAIYKNERQRVQQAFLMLIHASTGVRPSSTTRTHTSRKSTKRQPSLETKGQEDNLKQDGEDLSFDSTVFKLRYRDLQLSILRTENGPRYFVSVKFRHFKGETRRAQNKTFQWLDQDDVLMCPVSHLIALALHDKAFASGILTAEDFFKIDIPEGEELLQFSWRQDLLDVPIMRQTPDFNAPELSDSVTLKRLTKLGQDVCGHKYHLTWYCLRRMVLNAVDGIGSEEARNQISGHLDSRTYRAHYLDQQIHIDVIAAVKGQKSEGELIRKVNSMGIVADPRANRPLPTEELQAIENLPEMIEAADAFRSAALAAREAFGIIKSGPYDHPLYQAYITTGKTYRTLKQKLQVQRQSDLRKAYFETKGTAIIRTQLYGEVGRPAGPVEQSLNHCSPERAYLAALTKDPVDIRKAPLSQRNAAVQALATLCTQVVRSSRNSQSEMIQSTELPLESVELEHEDFPLKCHKLQCLFCLGDERLIYLKDRTRHFCREQKLWEHTTKHIDAIKHLSKISCPHPLCRQESVTLWGIQHLKTHAHAVHGIRLQKT